MINKLKNISETYNKRGFAKLLIAIYYDFKCKIFLLLKKKIMKKKIFSNSMFLLLNDPGISRTLILFGERELEHKYILDKIIKPNMTVLDIGSNLGYYALIELSIINENGYLICAEPSPENYKILNQNLKFNFDKNYETHNVAISEKNSIKDFYISKSSNLNTFHNSNDKGLNLSGCKISVNTSTILEISKNKKIDLIRMDVEGHEVSIFVSLLKYISFTNFFPSVIFEPHLSRYGNDNDLQIPLSKLFELGYRATYVGSSWLEGSEKVKKMGYKPIKSIETDGEIRMIFRDIANKDLMKLLINIGGLRSVYLEKI